MISTIPTLFSQRAKFSPLWSNASPKSRDRGDGGPGGNSPQSGVRRGGAPRQPQCLTLGRLAPLHYALRRRPRCPCLAHRAGAPHAPRVNGHRKWQGFGHRKWQGFGHRKWQGRPAAPRRERSDRSWAAGQERGRHDRASVSAGDPPSVRFARGWIALESSAWRRMR